MQMSCVDSVGGVVTDETSDVEDNFVVSNGTYDPMNSDLRVGDSSCYFRSNAVLERFLCDFQF